MGLRRLIIFFFPPVGAQAVGKRVFIDGRELEEPYVQHTRETERRDGASDSRRGRMPC
jgi:hypothetical protein